MKTIYIKPGVLEIVSGWGICLNVSHHAERRTLCIGLIYLTFYICLPEAKNCDDKLFGFYYYGNSIWYSFGKGVKSIDMPWNWTFVRHEVMYPDGLRKPEGHSWDVTDGRIVETYPYRYVLNSGEVQDREATVYVEEREWRWKWFKWLPFPRKIKRVIAVKFNDEVGERTGSWKGGCTGCGYEIKKGETIKDALMRMEKERRFK